MRALWRGGIIALIGLALAGVLIVDCCSASASTSFEKRHNSHRSRLHAEAESGRSSSSKQGFTKQAFSKHSFGKHGLSKDASSKWGKARYYSRGGGAWLQCVPFARAASGIELKGNAVNWWDAAAGVYERGSRPEAGSVLNFRANGRMYLGHVAVVRSVLGPREIEIDHANWSGGSKGNISRHVPVVDVSENNDWSAVRVGLGHDGEFGSVYSTYGFIYDRPDSGSMVANSRPIIRPVNDRAMLGLDEVAEAPLPHVIRPSAFELGGPDHHLH